MNIPISTLLLLTKSYIEDTRLTVFKMNIDLIQIKADNGPESSGFRTQFLS